MLATLTDWLWTYVLIAALLLVGLRFTLASRFVQVRLFKAMFAQLWVSRAVGTKQGISGFQALLVSVAGRVGGGNIAGVAVAITLGGPGALFWMWLIALLGMATSVFECSLAQLFKRRHGDNDFRGGPAFYMRYGLGWRVMPVVYSLLLLVTLGLGFNAVQAYAITQSVESAFGVSAWQTGAALTTLMAFVIFGGIRRIAVFSEFIVPLMVLGYFGVAMTVLIMNISQVPSAFALIMSSAFGFDEVIGGGIAAAVMQGARRGLFSNEAGLGTAPNVAAVADVAHPMSQGLIQGLSVFIDTIVLCTCTAMIILLSPLYQPGAEGVEGIALTQRALATHIGPIGEPLVSIALVLFATSSIAYNCYLGENSIAYFDISPKITINCFRLAVLALIAWASLQDMTTIFSFSDLTMGLLAVVNLVALWALFPVGMSLLRDFESRGGVSNSTFDHSRLPQQNLDPESWPLVETPAKTE
ncbi:alanine/glycine:cation symporter family protein [Luminiphilus sp. nBUS_16]|uniref:alanine/glycine:cation symporter family protein n=1 Tax=Luminiphilus sp. nBUS_16 TaxID=3395315 RepID=UPI003EBA576A